MIKFTKIYCLLLLQIISTLAEGAKQVPVIHRVGIIPASWQGQDAYGMENFKEHVAEISVDLINESKRFDVLNNDLVKSLWETPEGRSELKTEFELDSFIHFTIFPKQDHLIMTARILNEDLNIQLQESETIDRANAVGKSRDELKELMRPLTYRLLTRLPVDVSVTSVQGSYVTISGGENQALSVGDKLKIVRATIKAVHPAHGGWNNFEKVVVGAASIIETKPNVSVAKITSQIKEGAIQIGDGATITGLSTRRLFAVDSTTDKLARTGDDKILIPPKYQEAKKSYFPSKKIKLDENGKPIITANNPSNESADEKDSELTEDDAELTDDLDNTPNMPATAKIDPSQGDDSYVGDTSATLFGNLGVKDVAESIDIYPRYKSWTFLGPITTSTDMVLPFNEVEVSMKKSLNYSVKYAFGGLLGYGNTDNNSSFFSYGLKGSGYWISKLPAKLPIFQRYKLGVRANYDGRSVSAGQYGGNDYLTIGFFAGLEGEERIAEKRIGFTSDFQYTPMTIGRVGYNGTQNWAQSSTGWSINGSVVLKEGRKAINWGGGVRYGRQLIIAENSEETSIKQLSVEAIARWRF